MVRVAELLEAVRDLAQPPAHGGRPAALRGARPRRHPDARAGRAPERACSGSCWPSCEAAGIAIMPVSEVAPVGAGRARSHVPRQHLPRPDAACRRPRAAVPVHLESLALARRDAARPRDGPAPPRAREGARGAAALPADRRRRRPLRDARGSHRDPPRLALPGHGDRGARGLPGHARRRFRDRGGGRRPALGRRAGVAATALRRGRARRARELDVGRDAASAARAPACRRGLRVRRRRAARPGRPGRADRDRAARAALSRVAGRDAAAPARRRRRAGRSVRRHPRGRHLRRASLRRILDVGRAPLRAGRRRPRRARHQAHDLPHLGRLANGAGADPRSRAGQAGCGAGRAQGALRRGAQHRLGARAGARRRARRARLPGAQDAREVRARGAARARRNPPLRPHRHRQLPPPHGAALHRRRPLHLPARHRRRRLGSLQLPDRIRPPAALSQAARRAHRPARAHHRRGAAGDRGHGGRGPGSYRPEDERSRRPTRDRVAVRSVAGRRPGRSRRAQHLLPPTGSAGPVREHPRRQRARPFPRARAAVRVPRRRIALLPRLGRHDAAQPRLACRGDRARRGHRHPGRDRHPARDVAGRHAQLLPAHARRHLGAPPPSRG